MKKKLSNVVVFTMCMTLDCVLKAAIEGYVVEVIREQVTRRQAMDSGSRNLLRLMTVTCGYSDVRLMAVQRLEMWLANPKVRIEHRANLMQYTVIILCTV